MLREQTAVASAFLARILRAHAIPRALRENARIRMNPTRIYVDADACPVKDEIYRVAGRHGVPVSVVAGNFIRVPQDPLIERVAAGSAMDAADDWIAGRAGKGGNVHPTRTPPAG